MPRAGNLPLAIVWPRLWDALRLAKVVPIRTALTLDGDDRLLPPTNWHSARAHGMPGPYRSVMLAAIPEGAVSSWLGGSAMGTLVVPYFSTEAIERTCQANGMMCASAPASLQWNLEDKTLFREACAALDIPTPLWTHSELSGGAFSRLESILGLPFVAQRPHSSTCEGTYFVRDPTDWLQVDITPESPGTPLLCSMFAQGGAMNVHLLVDDERTALSAPSRVIVEIRGLRAVYLGNEFDAGLRLTKLQRHYITKVGDWLRSVGFRGTCGLDFLPDNDSLLALELNPRLQASSVLLSEVEHAAGTPLTLQCHAASACHQSWAQPAESSAVEAAQVSCIIDDRARHRDRNALSPGVYSVDTERLTFTRPGIGLQDLSTADEIVLVTEAADPVAPDQSDRVRVRWLCRRRVLTESGQLGPWAVGVQNLIAAALEHTAEL